MKKLFTLVVLLVLSLGVSAQTQVVRIWKNGAFKAIPISEVDSITFFTRREIPEHAVDLGLPSGTLWVDSNVGAYTPEGYGIYFAWGEVQSKDSYNWDTYRLCKGANGMTKYCTNRYYGYNAFTDDKDVLDPSDDVATHKMGEEWRMPTCAEFEELVESCSWTWTTRNGIDGYEVIGPNGNLIFFPATGYRSDIKYIGNGTLGYYWSCSLNVDYPKDAYYLCFNSEELRMYSNGRCYGRVVRAVVK